MPQNNKRTTHKYVCSIDTEEKFLSSSPILRQGTYAHKWDIPVDSDLIPLSVADMDFRVSPHIQAALHESISHGIFGYPKIPEKYYHVFINWSQIRHNFYVKRDWLICASGIVPSITAAITAVARKGEGVIIQEPVYNRFRICIENAGYQAIVNELSYKNGAWSIDFEDLECKAARPDSRVLLLCNPHNPIGRVWKHNELAKIGTICRKHDVVVISDESHCDFIYGKTPHIPFTRVKGNENCQAMMCFSPGKTFNISGLRQATIVIPCEQLRLTISKELEKISADDINTLAIYSQIAAYGESETWFEEVWQYIYTNYLLTKRFLNRYFPECLLSPLEGTYLLWVDVSGTGLNGDQAADLLENVTHIQVNKGTMYGSAGTGFVRINLACHRSVLKEALLRLKDLPETGLM